MTLFEQGERLLSKLEPGASELVQVGLEAAGVDVRCGTTPRGVTRGQEVELDLGLDGKLWCHEILVATGRVPRRDSLGLEGLGLNPSKWFVDTAMRVEGAEGWLYAVGDINGGATMLTHMGKYQARVAGDDIARRFGETAAHDHWDPGAPAREPVIPQVVFTNPEVGSVGLTLDAARARSHNVSSVDYDLGAVAGASLLDPQYQGWARVVIEQRDRRLLGATFVGRGTAELVYAATLAITSGVDVTHLWHVVPAYPTVSEIWLRLLETLRSETIRTG